MEAEVIDSDGSFTYSSVNFDGWLLYLLSLPLPIAAFFFIETACHMVHFAVEEAGAAHTVFAVFFTDLIDGLIKLLLFFISCSLEKVQLLVLGLFCLGSEHADQTERSAIP